ncbi:MAG: DEAD/DEAH box helicase family protein [Pyrobaculum sp.]|nr:DEAD/DEAH box helicase family protein [Pyrobaculum sp.]
MTSLAEILRSAGKDLYKHQLDFVSDALWLKRPRVLLADDVGLGKTIQALLLVKALMETGRVNHVLVVVPRAVFGQWEEELQRFDISHFPVENPEFPIGHRVYLVTLDRAKMPEYLDALSRIRWDLVVVDEAHKIRLGTQRQRLSHLCKTAGGCLLLTATPHTGDERDFQFLASLVEAVVRREKKDVEEYEGRKIFPSIKYWVVQVKASREEAQALYAVLSLLKDAKVEPIVRVVVEKRAMSSPVSFFKTLGRVVGGRCDEEALEEGELDACIGNVAGWKELAAQAERFASASDRKLSALRKLVETLRGHKILVFTEYATTAEYLFDAFASSCRVVDSGDGFAKADCGRLGVMYAMSRAREKIDVDREAALLAESHETALFISTDIMSEGVNLQNFDVVVNYEVVWSPTRHVQRVGRIWRFGQRVNTIYVVDMVLKTPAAERDEFDMYLSLLEKLYEISLKALPPQSYGEFKVYEVAEDTFRRVLEVGSAAFLTEMEVYEAAAGGRLDALRKKIEAIMREREKIRWKPKPLVEEGLEAKLGPLSRRRVEPGGGYYVAYVEYLADGAPLYRERVLARLASPLSRSREVPEALYREAEVPWDAVEEERGEVREDERSQLERKIHGEVWLSRLKPYLEKVRKTDLLPIGEPQYRVVGIARARVVGLEVVAGGFEDFVWQEVRRSRNIMRSELAAVNCVKAWLAQSGFAVREDYASVPRPFDMVVAKGRETYVVEVKGKWVGRRDDPISFTANEIDFASRFPDRYIICIAYTDGDKCVELTCQPFTQFQKEWALETVRGIEYKYNARRRP